jgi:sulfate adenylyltransferase subunit 1 (EFTu-like GTPase family)
VNNQPEISQDLEAMICWLGNSPMGNGGKYSIKHTTKDARAVIKSILYKINIENMQRIENISSLTTNDIARISLRITLPLMIDSYRKNRFTGSFILIDEGTNNTVAAGMII